MHRVSAQNRSDLAEYTYAAIVHPYWLVTTTLTPDAVKLRGLVGAFKSLLTHDHPLLSS